MICKGQRDKISREQECDTLTETKRKNIGNKRRVLKEGK